MNGYQYCVYCASCLYYEGKLTCEAKETELTMNQANRANQCKNFALSPMGHAITGKQYRPQKWKWIRKYS